MVRRLHEILLVVGTLLTADWLYLGLISLVAPPMGWGRLALAFGTTLGPIAGSIACGIVLLVRNRRAGSFLPARSCATYSAAVLLCSWLVMQLAYGALVRSMTVAWFFGGAAIVLLLVVPYLAFLIRSGRRTPLPLDALLIPILGMLLYAGGMRIRLGYDLRSVRHLMDLPSWLAYGLPAAAAGLAAMALCRRVKISSTWGFAAAVAALLGLLWLTDGDLGRRIAERFAEPEAPPPATRPAPRPPGSVPPKTPTVAVTTSPEPAASR